MSKYLLSRLVFLSQKDAQGSRRLQMRGGTGLFGSEIFLKTIKDF